MSVELFHVRYSIATPGIGAPVLTLDLLVDAPRKRVSGLASIFQSTNPPVEFKADVWGTFSKAKLDPAVEHHIILSLAGSPSGPTSQLAETFHLHGILNQDWQGGYASYRYFYGNRWQQVNHAVITPDNEPRAPEAGTKPTHHHAMPLYAAALQQARGSNDLAQMKALASQAELQLSQHEQIASALQQLNAEISRLDNRQ
ncbi:DUF1842 domain-containing protein [Chitinivorax sp. B]|uniref:DUF1842 domain-containing protein n=1 Tax=Chitinivorax sp. B TaxID=2502235 RepID=UPI0010F5A356|nr:DUF1842 domain-containing protein [Chitinivorax sp. B]